MQRPLRLRAPEAVSYTHLDVYKRQACLFLVTPLTGRDVIQYQVAGWLLLLGVVMWGVTYLARSREDKMRLDPSALE